MKSIRVRYAPSPTGEMHLGGLRTALYNYLFCKKGSNKSGDFVFRLEDTDWKREVRGAGIELERALEWAGIVADESPLRGGKYGPYVQSKRIEIYRKYGDFLIENKKAYRCFCSEDLLGDSKGSSIKDGYGRMYGRFCRHLGEKEVSRKMAKREPYVVRLMVPEGTTTFTDVIRGPISTKNLRIDDQVLLKSDGFPTYHLANVIDDHLMKISHVIRGEEWIPSTPKHVLLYSAFGWEMPEFAHLPLLLNTDGSKLSKREAHSSVSFFQHQGFLPSALLNFVALLGWTPMIEEGEIHSLDSLSRLFELNKVHHANAIVDIRRLEWFNQMHLRLLANTPQGLSDLALQLQPLVDHLLENNSLEPDVTVSHEYLKQVISCIVERIHFLRDIGPYFFSPPSVGPTNPHHRKMWDSPAISHIPTLVSELDQIPRSQFDSDHINDLLGGFVERKQIKSSDLLKPLRYLLTGTNVGAGIPSTMMTLGKERSLNRIQHASSFLGE